MRKIVKFTTVQDVAMGAADEQVLGMRAIPHIKQAMQYSNKTWQDLRLKLDSLNGEQRMFKLGQPEVQHLPEHTAKQWFNHYMAHGPYLYMNFDIGTKTELAEAILDSIGEDEVALDTMPSFRSSVFATLEEAILAQYAHKPMEAVTAKHMLNAVEAQVSELARMAKDVLEGKDEPVHNLSVETPLYQ